MWRLADRQIDEFHARGECEFIRDYAKPFAMLVIADLLGVPEEDHEAFQPPARASGTIGSTDSDAMAHSPLEFLYDRFTAYVEDRRREPRGDVLTGLASATFPDGSLPEVDRRRADRGQPVRGRSGDDGPTARGRTPADRRAPRAPAAAARRPRSHPELHRGDAPVRGPDQGRLPARPRADHGRRRRHPGRHHGHGAQRRREPRPAARSRAPTSSVVDRANARHHLAFGFGVHTCPGAPLARAEGRVSIERLLDRMADITISEAEHGPADAAPLRVRTDVHPPRSAASPPGVHTDRRRLR